MSDAPERPTMPLHAERWRIPEAWRPPCDVFAFHEDSNANAVLITGDGRVFAVAEERLSRKRFQGGFPRRALAWIESESGVDLDSAEVLVFGNRTHFLPRIFGRFFPSFEHDMFGPAHKVMLAYHEVLARSPGFMRLMTAANRVILRLRHRKPVFMVDHHYAHAASTYYTSGWSDACTVSVDNYGDGFAAKVFDCEGPTIRFAYGASASCSPGQFYGEIAQVVGIHPLLAGKLTGLSARGNPAIRRETMRDHFGLSEDGRSFTRTFGWLRSASRPPFPEFKAADIADLAAAAQERFEDVLVEYVRRAVKQTGHSRVALAGGCFANVRVNQRILELPDVSAVWIHPAMSDQGIAFGAALAYIASIREVTPFAMGDVYFGPAPNESDIRATLDREGLPYSRPDDIEAEAAELLAAGKVVARFDGPMEYGPRALGNRSVFSRATDADLQPRLNEKLKRSAYMPFAPVALEEHADRCFVGLAQARRAGRYMTISFQATDWMKEHCPGVVHVDGTVRPQILRESDQPAVYRLIDEYRKRTGIPCLVNTSFNLHSEPIVASPADACLSFQRSGLDAMIAGPFLVRQKNG